jgi:NAD(P)-dependent dehydrogenase (short-subunit alcohol dehydrogenase family)
MNQTEKLAVVTGANRGLGWGTCRHLAQAGIHTILTSRNPTNGQAAAQSLQDEGLLVTYQPLDVTNPDSIQALARYLEAQFGHLEILVNSAGVFLDPPESTIFNASLETVQATIETNLYGPLRVSQALIPLMRVRNYGRVVNVSSGMGQLSDMGGGYSGYRLSKTALNALTRILASELAGTNILVNSVCPGWVRTDMGGQNAPRSIEEGVETIAWLATLPDGSPSGGFFRDCQPLPW